MKSKQTFWWKFIHIHSESFLSHSHTRDVLKLDECDERVCYISNNNRKHNPHMQMRLMTFISRSTQNKQHPTQCKWFPMNFSRDSGIYSTIIIIRGQSLYDQYEEIHCIHLSGQIWNGLTILKARKLVEWKMKNRWFLTFGSEANTCCLTSQTNRSDGNCKHLNTFNSGTWTRTKSHPSRGSGGGSSSKPPPPANIGAWSIILWTFFFCFSLFFCDLLFLLLKKLFAIPFLNIIWCIWIFFVASLIFNQLHMHTKKKRFVFRCFTSSYCVLLFA